jgi:predicted permease
MATLLKEIRYAFRGLLKHPGFTAVAVITLALGIGANTAIFSVVNAVLFRPLPYRESERLVLVWGNFLKLNIEHLQAKVAEYNDYAEQSDIFEAVAAFDNQSFNLTGGERAERIKGSRVTRNLFTLLGAQPVQGRTFTDGEDQIGRDNVVILSYGFWQQHFAGDNVINRTITLDDRSYTVIGVMAGAFQFPHPNLPSAEPADIWLPLTYTTEQITERRGPYFLNVLARLKSGVTVTQASTAMAALAQRFEKEKRGYRGPNGEDGGWRINVVPLQEEIVGSSRRALFVLFGAVGLVLLIACANVANLLLLRAAARRREFAIRGALGANRSRILRQLLIEALVLTTISGALGLLLARWGVDLLTVLSPANLPRAQEIDIDSRVLAFTALVSIFTGIVFGLVPALQASRLDLQTALKGSNTVTGWPRQYWSNVLVIGEVALSLLLLIGAGLFVNSLLRLQRVKPGVAVDHLMTAEINLSASRYREPEQASSFYQELAQRIESLPGVQSATFSTVQPLSGIARNDPFAIEGRPLDPNNLMSAGWQMVGPNYFQTLGVQLIRGRDLAPSDLSSTAPVVAVINEQMVSRYWPNQDPIGHRISLGLPRPDNPWVTIIGIARDIPHRGVDSKAAPDWYLSRALGPQLNRYLLVRTAGNPTAVANAVITAVSTLDRDQPLTDVRTMNAVVSRTIAPRRFNTWLLGVFASLALTLAGLGIFSVISYSVTLRTQEIGIRMALGARGVNVLSLVLKKGMTLALIGMIIGLAGAFALTRLLSSLLFEVSATDPLTYFAVSSCSLIVALVACYIPARRAMKVDPIVTLKYE